MMPLLVGKASDSVLDRARQQVPCEYVCSISMRWRMKIRVGKGKIRRGAKIDSDVP